MSESSKGGEYLKSMVYGGMDGIITTFAIVCAASGANKDDSTIITMGVANLIADAISMGMGDFISDKAEQDYAEMELARRRRLAAAAPEEQKKALVQVYVKERGMKEADAAEVVARISKYEGPFAEELVQHCSGVAPPDSESSSAMKGLVTAASFITFGSVPLLIFLLKERISVAVQWYPQSPLGFSVLASAITMFLLGALAGTFTSQSIVKSGVTMALHGLLAAYAAYAIGNAMEHMYVDRQASAMAGDL